MKILKSLFLISITLVAFVFLSIKERGNVESAFVEKVNADYIDPYSGSSGEGGCGGEGGGCD